MDPRLDRLADILVNYSVDVKPGQQVALVGSAIASDLLLAIYRKVLAAGGHPIPIVRLDGADEIMLHNGSDDQLTYIAPVQRFPYEEADVMINIMAETNTRRLSGVDPARQKLASQSRSELLQTYMRRAAEGDLMWVLTLFPTEAYAQDASMSLADYQEFVFGAGKLDEADPVATWREVSTRQQRLIDWLDGKREVHVTGPDTDLRLSVEGRSWINADGKRNFPDGEIFTAPVEDSVEGTIRYSYPAIYNGREVRDIQLWFEGGKVVKATAGQNQEFLDEMLASDEGARRVGEFAIGTNFGIDRFTGNILFDEKIGGSIHLALGAGYPDTGSQNQSAIHWDMICDLRQGGQLTIDGDPVLKDGKIVVADWE